VYFDTNVYSEILDGRIDWRPTHLAGADGGEVLEIRLSPVNILEFLSTPDPLRREALVHLAQQICSPSLLPEVERLVASFVARQSAIPELIPLVLRDDEPASGIRAAWAQTKADPTRTLLVNDDLVTRFRSFRALFDAIHAHFRRGDSIEEVLNTLPWKPSSGSVSMEVALKSVAADRRTRTPAPKSSEVSFKSRDAAMLLTVIIVCAGLTPFEEPIDELWRALAVSREARLTFTFQRLSFLFEHGPLVGMGLALAAQWLRRSESGNVFDLYHLAYLPLCHMFITNDVELVRIAEGLSESEPFRRVRSIASFVDGTAGASPRR